MIQNRIEEITNNIMRSIEAQRLTCPSNFTENLEYSTNILLPMSDEEDLLVTVYHDNSDFYQSKVIKPVPILRDIEGVLGVEIEEPSHEVPKLTGALKENIGVSKVEAQSYSTVLMKNGEYKILKG